MNRCLALVASLSFFLVLNAVALLMGSLSAAAQDAPKPSAFGKDKLDQAAQLIREIFKEEFTKAQTDNGVKAELARTLLTQAKEIKEEADVRFVALSQARDLAAQVGDRETALAAIAELVRHYEVDHLKMKAEALALVLKATTEADRTKELAELAFGLANTASDLDRYDLAVELGHLAEAAAQKAGEGVLAKTIAGRTVELTAALKELQRIQPALDQLRKDPSNAKANLEVGQSWCFVRDKWEKGLPYLARGADARLKELAKKDLDNPSRGEDQARLAAGWWDLAQQQPAGPARLQMFRRSYQWYQQAVFQLDGAPKKQVHQRLKALISLLPPRLRVANFSAEVRRLEGHTAEVLDLAFSPRGPQAVSCGADRTLRLWDLVEGKQLRVFNGHIGTVYAVAFAPDGQTIFSCAEDRTLRRWRVDSAKEIRRYVGQTDFLQSVAVSTDGKLLAAGGQDKMVRLWDIDSGKQLQQLPGHQATVFRVVFSPDGKYLASCGEDQTARLWEIETGKEVQQYRGHTGQVLGLAFSPDGKHLLSSGEDRTIRLWEVTGGKEVRRYLGHTATVGSVAFTPDGLRFLSASDDRTLRLWDVEKGEEIRQLAGHTDAIYRVVTSPDGRWALSGSLDKTVRLWGERR
jgi:WD40 repeat protein